jgi:CheY-like chemotaxis protein
VPEPTPPPNTVDLSETLTEVARQRLPDALSANLPIFFDYEGPQPWVRPGTAVLVQRLGDFLLADAIGRAPGASVFFSASARAVTPTLCRLAVHVSDTGPGMDAVALRALQQQAAEYDARQQPLPALAGLPQARALSRWLDGHLSIDSLPGEGTVVRAEVMLECRFGDTEPPDAGDAKAWLIGQPPIVYEALTKRLHRFGWHIRLLPSVIEAQRFLQSNNRRARPALIVGTKMYGVSLNDLTALGETMGSAPRLAYLTTPDSDEARRENTGVDIEVPPFSVRQLAELTRTAAKAKTPRNGSMAQGLLSMANRPRLLVADDNELNQLLLSEMLHVLGYEVDIVPDGSAAIDYCSRAAPDGVLMDVQMPVVDGIEATVRLRRLQQEGRMRHFPIIAATALSSPDDREACFKAGMDGYLKKPLELLTLSRELTRHLPVGQPSLPERHAF